jgi:hypothetical protein
MIDNLRINEHRQSDIFNSSDYRGKLLSAAENGLSFYPTRHERAAWKMKKPDRRGPALGR